MHLKQFNQLLRIFLQCRIPQRDVILEPLANLRGWLSRLKERDGYRLSHHKWNEVAPLMREKLASRPDGRPDLSWID